MSIHGQNERYSKQKTKTYKNKVKMTAHGHLIAPKAGQQVALLTGSAPPATIEHSFRERIAQWRDFPFEGVARGSRFGHFL